MIMIKLDAVTVFFALVLKETVATDKAMDR
jgi:hypothetical protein